MTEYTDVPTVNALHQESEKVQAAIDMIQAGGAMTTFMISPPPPPPLGSPVIMTAPNMMMTVQITVPTDPPLTEDFMTVLTTWLSNRQAYLLAEMTALGVTAPAARTAPETEKQEIRQ